jgi:hypothetical protein
MQGVSLNYPLCRDLPVRRAIGEGRQSTHGADPEACYETADMVKGFGCRPVVTYPRALGRRPKAPQEGTGVAAWADVVYGDFTGQRFG